MRRSELPAGSGEDAAPRTLAEDARLIASLYDASEQGFLLHAWPELHENLDAFLKTVRTDFAELTWPDDQRRKLAAAIREYTQPPLVDLFRTALWSEWESGYDVVWREKVRPRAEEYRQVFVQRLEELADRLPGLHEVVWVLSHPLRTHGRLLGGAGKPSVLIVGVADPELGVEEFMPVVQGCHEHFVRRVQSSLASGGRWSTVPGRAGYGAFREAETAALVLGARLFSGTRWEAWHLGWLGRLFLGDPPEKTAAWLADGEMLSPEAADAVREIPW